MSRDQTYQRLKWFLTIIYAVGIVGLSLNTYRSDFNNLTPLNLWLSSGIILFCSEKISLTYLFWILAVFLGGFFVEMLGVKTGFPFGDYAYGGALGLKVNDIPVTIGLNWMLLTLGAISIMRKTKLAPIVQSILGALLMVLVDVLIEPVAIKLDFWQWESSQIPLSNYLAWGLIAFLFIYSFHALKIKTTNKIASYLFGLQTVFFLVLNFTL
jgi:putative membrane protein